jgi:hypothetical protein
MLWRVAVFSVLLGLAIVGCAQAPPDEAVAAAESFPEGMGVIQETLSTAESKKMAGCRNEATTGNRVKQWECLSAKDDREMLSIINMRKN